MINKTLYSKGMNVVRLGPVAILTQYIQECKRCDRFQLVLRSYHCMSVSDSGEMSSLPSLCILVFFVKFVHNVYNLTFNSAWHGSFYYLSAACWFCVIALFRTTETLALENCIKWLLAGKEIQVCVKKGDAN